MLDTEADICHRKQLSMAAFKKYENKLTSKKLNLQTRIRMFNIYVTSIFMYNSELWTLTKKLENEIDVFHRKFLRWILKIHYPFTIRNETLYEKTNEMKWSKVIETRRLRWTGHLLRLPEETPAWKAFAESNKYSRNQKKTNKLTWKKLVDKNLKYRDPELSLQNCDLRSLAADRDWWRGKVVCGSVCMSN